MWWKRFADTGHHAEMGGTWFDEGTQFNIAREIKRYSLPTLGCRQRRLGHHGQLCLNTGPAFGVDETQEEWVLLSRTLSYLPSCPVGGQSIQESRPILLRECVRDRSSHAMGIVPGFGTSGLQVSRIAGELDNTLDLFFGVLH